uniref:Uncharacterized protein n=1 Tax=Cucumis sativus TaxID=3659 RepID=A0A0A0K440_CUCSA
MAKKRKSIATSLDEVDRTMYASFCSAANSLSQLYTQAMNHQKLSFQAGERHAMVWNFICSPFPLFGFYHVSLFVCMKLIYLDVVFACLFFHLYLF